MYPLARFTWMSFMLSAPLAHALCHQAEVPATADSATTWKQRATFPASSRNYGLGFSIGNKGYYCLGQKQTKPFVYKTYNDLWEYDPSANTWTQKADFPGPGRLMAKGFSVDNKIYAGYGYIISASGPNAGSNDHQTDLYRFDPPSNKWEKMGASLLGRGDLFFTINGKMYAVNPEFRTVNRYNAETDSWFESKWEKDEIAPASSDVAGANISFSAGNKEYIITTTWKKNRILNQLWELDPHLLAWRRMNDLPGKGSDTLYTFTSGEKNLLIRGNGQVLEYMQESDSWTARKDIPAAHRDFYPVFCLEGKNYGFSKFEFWEFIP